MGRRRKIHERREPVFDVVAAADASPEPSPPQVSTGEKPRRRPNQGTARRPSRTRSKRAKREHKKEFPQQQPLPEGMPLPDDQPTEHTP